MNTPLENTSESVQLGDKAQIENVVTAWAEGIRTKDIEVVVRQFIGEPVNFFLAPPLVGEEPLRQNLAEWFATFEGGIHYEIRGLEIFVGQDVGWCRALNHLSGTKTDGQQTDLWFRVTLGFTKTESGWKIAHVHESVPFLMDGSDKAALDLKP